MKRSAIAILVFIIISMPGYSQQAHSMRYTTPKAGDVNLGNTQDKYEVKFFKKEMPEPDGQIEQKKLMEAKEIIRKKFPRKLSTINSSVNRSMAIVDTPSIILEFQTDSFSGIPPDNSAAVSNDNRMVAVMNDRINVFNPFNDSSIHNTSLEVFSIPSGLTHYTVDYRYDPKVVYDPIADRFICIMLNSTDSYNDIVLAFSQTNDPNGTWSFYVFTGDYLNDTTWFDYPAISITKDEVFFTGNHVKFDSSWQAGFKESVIYQVKKSDGYSGSASLTYRIYDNISYEGSYLRCLYPLNPSDSVLGPSQYLLSNRDFDILNDTIFLVKIPDTIGATDSILTVTPLVSSLSYGMPPDALQPDTAVTLATNDNRMLGGYIHDNEIQFVNTTVNPINGAASIYHGIISNFTTSPVVTATIFSVDNLDFGYPNISYTGSSGTGHSQSIISFDYSGPSTYPGFGAVFFNGSAYSGITVIRKGDSSINVLSGKEQRWGDYSGSQPYWNSLGNVFVMGLYGRKNHAYGNYFAELGSPYSSVGITTPKPAKVNRGILFPNPAKQFVSFQFNISVNQEYNFIIYDINGRAVDKLADMICTTGENTIQFNIASLKPGTYMLQATGKDGTTIPVQTFVRN